MKTDGPATAEQGIRRLRFDTGATWLDLVATVGNAYGPEPVERLYSIDRLSEWLHAERLLPRTGPMAADLIRTRELREGLRALGLAATRSEAWPKKAVTLVNDVLAGEQPLALRVRRAGLVVDRPATTDEALARIARQAAEHLTGPVASTLRTCADRECGMLFIDPNGRRRWCAADICGVRNRVRAHRERQARLSG